jgi:cysteine-rich repeat protein
MVRTIPAPGDGQDFNFAVSLPPETYHAHLEAHTTAPHAVTCLGDANFTVTAGQTATASITLTCDDDLVNGDQKFEVKVDSKVCPLYVDFASTSPTTVNANGGVATLTGTAHDETSAAFTYSWAAPAGTGTITDTNSADGDATFTCGPANNGVVLTLTATRADQGCSDSLSVFVNCASALCGNGSIDASAGENCDDGNTVDNDGCPANCFIACGDHQLSAGEQCDPENGTTCGVVGGQHCQLLPVCGDGVKNGTEECDLGPSGNVNGGACEANCTLPKCGNNIKDSGEDCDGTDTNPSRQCQTDCHFVPAAAQCGDSVVGGSEQCDPAVVGFCTSTCTLETTPACLTCEQNVPACASQTNSCNTLTGNVSTLSGSAAGHGANLFAGQPNALACNTVLECVRRTNCANVSYTDCVCGIGADATECFNGNITDDNGDLTGPCVNEIAGALQIRKNQPSNLIGNLTDLTKPGGSAMSRIVCDRTNCAGGAVLGTASNQTCFAP